MTSMVQKILIISICLAFFISSFCSPSAKPEQPMSSHCYGFLVPLPAGTDTTQETFVNSQARQLINDLLRERIMVYWSAEDFSAQSQIISSGSPIENIFYKKGAFIIPFSSNISTTALITAIVTDYNSSSEIATGENPLVPVYLLMEPLNLTAYELVEPKIAQQLGTPTRYGWPCYLLIAEAGGFLSMEFLLDNETPSLNTHDFNVFMWPYDPTPGNVFEQLQSLTNTQSCNAIRAFVRNGGGYIGSCYGALAASSGLVFPVPFISLGRAYLPNLSCSPLHISLSLTDTLMSRQFILEDALFVTTATITNPDHPLAYGMNTTVKEFFKGPWFTWVGKDTNTIARLDDMVDENGYTAPLLRGRVLGTPNWVDSHFGKGTVVLFSTHPEFVNNISLLFEGFTWDGDKYYGRRVVQNALFYTTAKGPWSIHCDVSYPVSQIDEYREKTLQLALSDHSFNEFADNISKMEDFSTQLDMFQSLCGNLTFLYGTHYPFDPLFNQHIRLFTYAYDFCPVYNHYINSSIQALTALDRILPLLQNDDDSVNGSIQQLHDELSMRLNNSRELLLLVTTKAYTIRTELEQHTLVRFLEKPGLIQQSRYFLRTFETGLKYIPQLSFESLKTLRHLWYQYEGSIAVS